MREAYAGIDVAISAGKRLPVCVAIHQEGRLVPLPLRGFVPLPPKGPGNCALVRDPEIAIEYACEALEYLRALEHSEDIRIRRVAIDAPHAPRDNGLKWRKAEHAMYERGISVFATPSEEEFRQIIAIAQNHLAAGGACARLPNANRFWMLAGFALFRALAPQIECIEVYPQATAWALGVNTAKKLKQAGLQVQLHAATQRTGWPDGRPDEPTLAEIGYGSKHDRLDAYLSTWIASLPEEEREPCGEAPDDVIWIPRIVPAGTGAGGAGHALPYTYRQAYA
jgi:predicted nuclease with RNAse H fold